MQAKNAIMVHSQAKRVTTNAGYTMSFVPDVEKFVPGIAVAQALKYGARVVRYLDGEMMVPGSADPVKVPEIVRASVVEEDTQRVQEATETAAEEFVSSTSETDAADEVDRAVKNLGGSFTPKETRIKDAILKLISTNNPDDFVLTTGRPKITALSTALGGDSVTAEVRDSVWMKMEAAGIIEMADS